MIDLEEFKTLALKQAKSDLDSYHFYSIDEGDFTVVDMKSFNEFLQSDEYDDPLFLSLLDNEKYFPLPIYEGDDEGFIKTLLFKLDFTGFLDVEADDKLTRDFYDIVYKIINEEPYKIFKEEDPIYYNPDNNQGVESAIFSVLGGDGGDKGLVLYFGKDGYEDYCSLRHIPYTHNDLELLAFHQRAFTIYVSESNPNSIEYEMTKIYLGEEIANEMNISTIIGLEGRVDKEFLHLAKTYITMHYLEAFLAFLKKYKEDNLPLSEHKEDEYIEFVYINEDKDEAAYKLNNQLDFNYFYMPTHILSYFSPVSVKEIRKTSKIYEFGFRGLGDVYHMEDNEYRLYHGEYLFCVNHKTGDVIYFDLRGSNDANYLTLLAESFVEVIREEGLPKKFIISNYGDAELLMEILDLTNPNIIEIGETNKIDELIETIGNIPRNDYPLS